MNKPDNPNGSSAEAKPAQAPAKPVEPVKPVAEAKPAAAPGKAAEPTKSVAEIKPAVAVAKVKPVAEAKPAVAPAKAAEPTKPVVEVKPAVAAAKVKPVAEAKPAVASAKAAEPTKPVAEVKPAAAATKVKPVAEGKPAVAPAKPAAPTKPFAKVKPAVAAAKPAVAPTQSAGPKKPVADVKPAVTPTNSAEPAKPVAIKAAGKDRRWLVNVSGCGYQMLKRNRLLALLVLLPFLLAVLYFGLLAKDRYASDSIVVVKRADDLGGANLNLGALLTGGSATMREDAMLLQQYILAPDMLKKLDAKLDFKTAFAASGWDLFQRLPKNVSFEDYLDYYRSKISVGFDEKTSVLTISTQGFTPEFAQQFNQAVLAESESFINELSHKISREEMLFANQEINRAYGQLQGAKETLLTFQNDNNLVDPQVQIEATSRLVAELQAKQAQLEAELTNYLSYLNDDTPQIKAARSAIESIQAQIEKERATLTSSDDEQLNQKMFEFEELKAKVAFEGDLYKLSLTALEKARVEAARKAKSLAVVSQPYLAEDARYPRRLYMLLTVLLVSLLVYGLTKVTLSIIEDHKI